MANRIGARSDKNKWERRDRKDKKERMSKPKPGTRVQKG